VGGRSSQSRDRKPRGSSTEKKGAGVKSVWFTLTVTKILPGNLEQFYTPPASSSYDGIVRLERAFGLAVGLAVAAQAQIIEFESGGLKYKAMTRGGVTIMFSALPTHIRDYAILQVAISNGSPVSWTVKPADFGFERADGQTIQALPARTVVTTLAEKASRGDVIKLVAAYEASLYGNVQIRSTNGYEVRRQNAFAEVGSTRLKAAAAASAIAMVTTKLAPGQSTDGAVFFPNQGKPLGTGQVVVNAAGEMFVFPVEASRPLSDPHPRAP